MSAATGNALLREGIVRLRDAGIENAPKDARRLLAHALGVAPDRLTLALHDPVPQDAYPRFRAAVEQRARFQPVAQIIGQRQFWGRAFKVTRDTLDPRPETEILVAAALEAPFDTILDLGTGTGCILLSCLCARPSARGLGTDVSQAALAVAQENAQLHDLSARTELRLSDWFDAVTGRYDLIVSNPPYIAAAEMAGLSRDVLEWEPHGALSPGGDGLDAYRMIAKGVMAHLNPGGRVIVEIGPTQAAAVCNVFAKQGLDVAPVRNDLDGRDRVVIARRPLD